MLPDLADVLQYKNSYVLDRYQSDFPHAILPAQDALTELLKYMWICLKHRADKHENPNNRALQFTCLMHAEMLDIDHMWHTFLLFTEDYQTFCRRYLHIDFFHHHPLVKNSEHVSGSEYERELGCYLSYIYDHLGQETVAAWFREALLS
jgi:hypothetical protein